MYLLVYVLQCQQELSEKSKQASKAEQELM